MLKNHRTSDSKRIQKPNPSFQLCNYLGEECRIGRIGRTREAEDIPYPEANQKETKMATIPVG